MNVSASFLCSEATFYSGAWHSCWDCKESFALTVGRTQNTIPSKVLHRWAPIFMVFVSNLGNWWWMVAISRPFTSRKLTMKLHDRGIPKLNAQKNGSVRTGPQNWMCTQHILSPSHLWHHLTICWAFHKLWGIPCHVLLKRQWRPKHAQEI